MLKNGSAGMTGGTYHAGRLLPAVGLARYRPLQLPPGYPESLPRCGRRHVAMFTGDRLSVATRVGQAVGVDMIEAECLPEEKNEQIRGPKPGSGTAR